jgi:hypothetical protein
MTGMRYVIQTSSALLVAFLLSGCVGVGDSGTMRSAREISGSMSSSGIHAIVLTGGNGDVHMRAGGGNTIAFHARLQTRHAEELGADTVTIVRRGDTAVISSVCPAQGVLGWHVQTCDVDYEIAYPRALTASLTIANGDLTIEGASVVNARTTNGDVTVKDASGDVDAIAHQGDVSVSLAPGWKGTHVGASTRFGDVRLAVPSGFRARMHVGHPWAGDVDEIGGIKPGPATVDASTVFGDIEVVHDT